MKKLILLAVSLLISFNIYSQEIILGITVIEIETYRELKSIIKRFDKAVIGKDYFINIRDEVNDLSVSMINSRTPDYSDMSYEDLRRYYAYPDGLFNYFIEIEEGDLEETYKFLGIKIRCVPKKYADKTVFYLII